ncbi:MAG: tetraacyldisaccharide 4'-kinase [Nitrospirae bacterium]|nr:tetraacyldisaccharide 4'-kinase [Nitrospirota bacterium]
MSFLYGIILKVRAFSYTAGLLKKRKLNAKVISVGNITVGGTGKTPMVIALAEILMRNNKKAAVVSRGYKSKGEKGLNVVSDGKGIKLNPESAGDEPYLITERLKDVPVLICADRYESGRYAIENFGVDTIILDDGFQNLAIKKDIDILLIDAMNPFGSGYLLPRGILREPLSAISRADIIIITKADIHKNISDITDTIKLYNAPAPIFKAIYKPSELVNIATGRKENINTLKNKSVTIFSGIANPLSFSYLIENAGADIVEEFIFNDHYSYTKDDIDRIRLSVKKADMIITTEKDAVKIRGLIKEDINIWAVRIDLSIDNITELERLLLN